MLTRRIKHLEGKLTAKNEAIAELLDAQVQSARSAAHAMPYYSVN